LSAVGIAVYLVSQPSSSSPNNNNKNNNPNDNDSNRWRWLSAASIHSVLDSVPHEIDIWYDI
jgi:hypothetical protein